MKGDVVLLGKIKKFHKSRIILMTLILNIAFNPYCLAGSSSNRAWPWRTFIQSLVDELTGPLPFSLGTLGLAWVAYSMFSGNAGDGSKKGLLVVVSVSIALAAPTIMSWVSSDAGGLLFK